MADTQTPWTTHHLVGRLRATRTEVAGAVVLVAAIVVAVLWANVSASSYDDLWGTDLSIRLGAHGVEMDLREWLNSGLMTLFFLVVGLEARREFDLGELRDRTRIVLPAVAGLLGMALPVGLFLLLNHGTPAAHGFGLAMSTDTALALGALSLLGRGVSEQVRVFLLTVFVVDDLAALVVIAAVYSDAIHWVPLVVALVAFAVLVLAARCGISQPLVFAVIGLVVWLALLESGVDPVVSGLLIGLTASAYTPTRDTLEQATTLFRRFREEPTADLARTATIGMSAALAPNMRLQRFYLPWTSYGIVPLFALANAGFGIDGPFLADAVRSPITLGVVLGYLVGKPLAVLGSTWLVTTLSRGRIRLPLGWAAVAGSGTAAATGFTVSLLVANLAFEGPELAQAKAGVLAVVILSAVLTAVIFRVVRLLPPDRQARALLGRAEDIVDLVVPVDPERDHVRGAPAAHVTLVEYGDFECPHCGEAEPAARAELADDADLRFVWRHLPLADVHPRAQLAAEAAEAAGAQGAFWEMHDLLLDHQHDLEVEDLVGYAERLALDLDRFRSDLAEHEFGRRVTEDEASADLSGVSGTPTFFVNGRRHHGAYDYESLREAIKLAHARVASGR